MPFHRLCFCTATPTLILHSFSAEMSENPFFGEIALLLGAARTASASVPKDQTTSTNLCYLSKWDFEEVNLKPVGCLFSLSLCVLQFVSRGYSFQRDSAPHPTHLAPQIKEAYPDELDDSLRETAVERLRRDIVRQQRYKQRFGDRFQTNAPSYGVLLGLNLEPGSRFVIKNKDSISTFSRKESVSSNATSGVADFVSPADDPLPTPSDRLHTAPDRMDTAPKSTAEATAFSTVAPSSLSARWSTPLTSLNEDDESIPNAAELLTTPNAGVVGSSKTLLSASESPCSSHSSLIIETQTSSNAEIDIQSMQDSDSSPRVSPEGKDNKLFIPPFLKR